MDTDENGDDEEPRDTEAAVSDSADDARRGLDRLLVSALRTSPTRRNADSAFQQVRTAYEPTRRGSGTLSPSSASPPARSAGATATGSVA